MLLNQFTKQLAYHKDIVSSLFIAAADKNNNMIESLLKLRGISLNIVNENGENFINTWCNVNPQLIGDRDFQQLEIWINSGKIDLTFQLQGADIIQWCINKIVESKYESTQKKYLNLAEKIIQFMPTNQELLNRYNTLVLNSMKSLSTFKITETLLSIPGLDLQAKNNDDKDIFQVALELKNLPAINLLAEKLNLLNHSTSHLTTKEVQYNQTIERLKALVSSCLSLMLNNKIDELEERLVQINIKALHLFEDKGEYPANFAELLFELSNNLSVINNGQFADVAYNLRKVAADLGETRAQNIIRNFSNNTELVQQAAAITELQEDVKSIYISTSSSQGKSQSFFKRIKSNLKEKPLLAGQSHSHGAV
ncbi:Uncharacterised protein [Legionella busanensis]|uniref:Uncharacterized protein n=1 Tax=Legionella busanensis TaxID=190655 RepID=A0A378JJU3_9GAMM|nr:hypothetical protein [Legionella busanensis]STX51596.1 Uncharacterised protein [Legionella busanensis]